MDLALIEKQAQDEGMPFAIVLGEVLQVAFLDALYADKASTEIYFQGGTSLRLLHGGWRYSEDLDFVTPFDDGLLHTTVASAYARTRQTIVQLFGASVPHCTLDETARCGRIKAWWLMLTRPGDRRKYRVKLEFAAYPVYEPQSLPVQRLGLPIPITPLVRTESLAELLADKIGALAGRPYVKGRDLFDLWYLRTVLAVSPNHTLIARKFHDYRVAEPVQTLRTLQARWPEKPLADEMARFLPRKYRQQLAADGYAAVQRAVSVLIDQVCTTHA